MGRRKGSPNKSIAENKLKTSFLPDGTSNRIRKWHIRNNILEVPSCECGNSEVKFIPKYDKYLCDGCHKKLIEKIKKENNMEKYGVDHVSKVPKWKAKREATNMERYGGVSPLSSPIVHKKGQDTLFAETGFRTSIESIEGKAKREHTSFDRFGKSHPMKNDDIKKKQKETVFNRYGVNNVMQHPDVMQKSIDTCMLKYNQPTTPGQCKIGYVNKIHYQGSYEKDFLLSFSNEYDIQNTKGMKIYYDDEGTKRMYVPDFFIPSKNLIVEIKSTWTFNQHKKKNLAKEQECLKQGFNFIFIIDKDYSKFINL